MGGSHSEREPTEWGEEYPELQCCGGLVLVVIVISGMAFMVAIGLYLIAIGGNY